MNYYTVVVDFFKEYGWQLGLLALSGIVVLGFLKKIGVFKKLNDKYKKYVYFALSSVFSIIACTIYVLINKSFVLEPYLLMCLMVFVVTVVAYHIYEHIGLRWVWNKIVDFFVLCVKKLFCLIFVHKVSADKIKKEMLKFGVDEAIKVGQELKTELQNKKVEGK